MNLRPIVFMLFSVLASAALLPASDPARYREFQLGMPLADVANDAGIASSEVKLVVGRPERVEELGAVSASVAKEMVFNSGYDSTVRVIAQWDDTKSLLSLVGFSYGHGYGVIVSSTSSQVLARRAMAESERLDLVEAPQRALDQQAKQAADDEARDEKVRLLSKLGFRP